MAHGAGCGQNIQFATLCMNLKLSIPLDKIKEAHPAHIRDGLKHAAACANGGNPRKARQILLQAVR